MGYGVLLVTAFVITLFLYLYFQPVPLPPHIYYINLDKRQDRNKEFLGEMARLNIVNFTRISATHMPKRGALGCSLSHIKALELFLESTHSESCILEDDFTFVLGQWQVASLFKTLQTVPYDVCLLAANVLRSEPTEHAFLRKVDDAQTTAGYCVSKAYARTLLANFKEGAAKLKEGFETDGKKEPRFCLDIFWKSLQPTAKWYVVNPKMGIQRDSYSDIEERSVRYGV